MLRAYIAEIERLFHSFVTPLHVGRNQVTVPTRFFKVILSLYGSPPKAIGFVFNNEPATKPLRNYAVSVDSVEQLTGLDFFSPLPDSLENKLESQTNIALWKI